MTLATSGVAAIQAAFAATATPPVPSAAPAPSNPFAVGAPPVQRAPVANPFAAAAPPVPTSAAPTAPFNPFAATAVAPQVQLPFAAVMSTPAGAVQFPPLNPPGEKVAIEMSGPPTFTPVALDNDGADAEVVRTTPPFVPTPGALSTAPVAPTPPEPAPRARRSRKAKADAPAPFSALDECASTADLVAGQEAVDLEDQRAATGDPLNDVTGLSTRELVAELFERGYGVTKL